MTSTRRDDEILDGGQDRGALARKLIRQDRTRLCVIKIGKRLIKQQLERKETRERSKIGMFRLIEMSGMRLRERKRGARYLERSFGDLLGCGETYQWTSRMNEEARNGQWNESEMGKSVENRNVTE